MSTYNREDIVITLEGPDGMAPHIVEGYADGTFLTVVAIDEGYTRTAASHGQNTRNRVRKDGLDITIRLHGGSPSNDALQERWDQDGGPDGTGSDPFRITIRDMNSGDLVSSDFAYVQKTPDFEAGNEIGQKEWMIQTLDGRLKHGGQNFQVS